MQARENRRRPPRTRTPVPPIRPAAAVTAVALLAGLVLAALVAVPGSPGPGSARRHPRSERAWDAPDAGMRRAFARMDQGRRRAEAARSSFAGVGEVQTEAARYVVVRSDFLRREIARLDGLAWPAEADVALREDDAAELGRLAR